MLDSKKCENFFQNPYFVLRNFAEIAEIRKTVDVYTNTIVMYMSEFGLVWFE